MERHGRGTGIWSKFLAAIQCFKNCRCSCCKNIPKSIKSVEISEMILHQNGLSFVRLVAERLIVIHR